HPRVAEGVRLLLDRSFDEGGINYGNRRIFGKATEPIPAPTALMLLALQGHRDPTVSPPGLHPRVVAALHFLQQWALADTDLFHLCWAKLALDTYRDQPGVVDALPVLDERIRAAHEQRRKVPWLRPAPVREALTVLALATEQTNLFRLTNAE